MNRITLVAAYSALAIIVGVILAGAGIALDVYLPSQDFHRTFLGMLAAGSAIAILAVIVGAAIIAFDTLKSAQADRDADLAKIQREYRTILAALASSPKSSQLMAKTLRLGRIYYEAKQNWWQLSDRSGNEAAVRNDIDIACKS